MDNREARQLLGKYWEAETTLEEEQQLKAFFSNHTGSLPSDLSEAAPLFGFYQEEAARKMPDGAAPWEDVNKITTGKYRRLWMRRNYWEYAAIFILVLSSMWVLRPTTHTTGRQVALQDTFDDPQQAMIATQKALEVLAANLNKGKNEMQKLSLFNEVQQKIEGE